MNHTEHAPAERVSWEELHAQMTALRSNEALQGPVKVAQEHVLILNAQRQIIYANSASQRMLCEDQDPSILYGCRPGESMHCIHANTGEGGCGTSKHCRTCKAVNTVLKSIDGSVEVQRCSIQRINNPKPFEFILFTMPVHIQDATYILVAIEATSAIEDSKHALAQRVFTLQRLAGSIDEG